MIVMMSMMFLSTINVSAALTKSHIQLMPWWKNEHVSHGIGGSLQRPQTTTGSVLQTGILIGGHGIRGIICNLSRRAFRILQILRRR